MGQDLSLLVDFQNKSNVQKTVQAHLVGAVIYYTGVVASQFKDLDFSCVVPANQSERASEEAGRAGEGVAADGDVTPCLCVCFSGADEVPDRFRGVHASPGLPAQHPVHRDRTGRRPAAVRHDGGRPEDAGARHDGDAPRAQTCGRLLTTSRSSSSLIAGERRSSRAARDVRHRLLHQPLPLRSAGGPAVHGGTWTHGAQDAHLQVRAHTNAPGAVLATCVRSCLHVCVCVCFRVIEPQASVSWKEPFSPRLDGVRCLVAVMYSRNLHQVTTGRGPMFTFKKMLC